ncbi:MAG: hypothetical protein R3E01_10790 [Pirellulaceae bacterium]|nr:hypothetical protein [Planctomycetales bacterium]
MFQRAKSSCLGIGAIVGLAVFSAHHSLAQCSGGRGGGTGSVPTGTATATGTATGLVYPTISALGYPASSPSLAYPQAAYLNGMTQGYQLAQRQMQMQMQQAMLRQAMLAASQQTQGKDTVSSTGSLLSVDDQPQLSDREQAKQNRRDEVRRRNVDRLLEMARQAEADGRTNVARQYYRRAQLAGGTSETATLVKAELQRLSR